MKKIYLSFLVIVFTSLGLMAQINREIVLVEIATGTTCQFCPGSAMALDDMYAAGDPVAGIEYHSYSSSDPFNTPEAAARNQWYGVSGYPTAQFDGEYDEYVGGSNTNSMYSSYIPIVNTRMTMQTNFGVEIYGDNTGTSYSITVRVTKFGSYSGTNLKVRFALTETAIPYNWYSLPTIDYCERLMAPDENGTAVSFASGDVQDVLLTFTFDNTWVDSNCELIAWIQDDANKFVLHSASVMLLNLEPDVANANFSSSSTEPCEGTTVDFIDQSAGAITSWNWTFEGGTPATSTDQNPTVNYATQGVYDVTLFVSDGTTNSTLSIPDMINVKVPPAQPNTPAGEVDVCASGTYVYTTDAVPNTDSYIWEVSPSDAGSITGTGIEGTFVSDASWTGSYTITVRADNNCGSGTWSSALSCNLNQTPLGFLLSEGGGMCEGSSGIEITQDGSETGIDYELYRDGTYTGTNLSGTGNPLNWGNQTDAGTYTVIGIAPLCDLQMWGTPWLYYIETPLQPDPPSGSTAVCNGETSNYSVSLIDYADTIYWDLQPANAGNVIGGYFEADIEWDASFSGLATLAAQGANQCGTGPVSDITEIQVDATPTPIITGSTLICNDEQGEYSVTEVTGNTYAWTVTGGEIVSGAGTNSVIILWGDPGMGNVSVVETSANDCIGTSGDYEVTIDDCVGIGELEYGELKLFPNPATNNIEVSFIETASVSYSVAIYNNLGQIMNETKGIATGTNESIQLDVSKYQTGIYIVVITSENGLNIRSTFEKIR